jgi:hypothetical protein
LEQLVKTQIQRSFSIHHVIYVVNCAVEYMIYLLVGGAVEGGAGFNAILPKLLARQKKEIEDNLQVKLSHVSHFKVLTYG